MSLPIWLCPSIFICSVFSLALSFLKNAAFFIFPDCQFLLLSNGRKAFRFCHFIVKKSQIEYSFSINFKNCLFLIKRLLPKKRTKEHFSELVNSRSLFCPILKIIAASQTVNISFSQILTSLFIIFMKCLLSSFLGQGNLNHAFCKRPYLYQAIFLHQPRENSRYSRGHIFFGRNHQS